MSWYSGVSAQPAAVRDAKRDLDARTETCSPRPKIVKSLQFVNEDDGCADSLDLGSLEKFRPGQAWMQTTRLYLKRRTGSIARPEVRDGQKWAPTAMVVHPQIVAVMRGPTGAAKSRAPRGNRDHPQRNSRPAQGPIALTGQGAHRTRRCKTASAASTRSASDIVQQDMLCNGSNGGGDKEMDVVTEQFYVQRWAPC